MMFIRRIFCFFGFHQYIPIRGSAFEYRQKEPFLFENQNYIKETELICNKLYCPFCGDKININIKK